MVSSLVLGLRLRQTQQRRKYWGQTGAVFNLNFFNEKTVIYKLCHCISFTLWYNLQDMSSINIKYAFAQKKKKKCKLQANKWTGLFSCRHTWGIWSLDSSNIQRGESTRGQGVRFLAPCCRSDLFGWLICRAWVQ